MIKKYILGLGIGLLSFIGFSNATYQIFDVGLDKYVSNWNSQYDIGFLNKGRFISSYLGSSKNIIALNDQYLIFWSDIGLYLYNPTWRNDRITQGFFQYFQSCDEINYNSTGDFLQNCSSVQKFEFSGDLVPNFMTYIKQGDKVYIEDYIGSDTCGSYCSYGYYTIKVCFSSDEIGKTLCLVGGDRNITMSPYGEPYPFVNAYNLQNDVNFANINRSLLTDPPGFKNNIEGGSNTSENVSISGNLVYNPCTNGYVINKIRQTYGSEIDVVCYAGSTNTGEVYSDIDPGSGIPKMGFNFKEIYQLTNDGMSWSTWFNSYADDMLRWKQGRVGVNPFVGRPVALYSYFSILFDHGYIYQGSVDGPDGMGPYFILNYCKLGYSDLNAPYDGTYFKTYCSSLNGGGSSGGGDYNTGDIGTVDGDGEVLPPGFDIGGGGGGGGGGTVTSSGTVISVDWSGVLSGDTNQNFDGTNFINNFYQKLQANFQKPTNNLVGIIPNYILVFMFALILFRFLSH